MSSASIGVVNGPQRPAQAAWRRRLVLAPAHVDAAD
jgi:hypothetical protein